jgi:hypothetical protein
MTSTSISYGSAVIAEKGQFGYSPAYNIRNYGSIEGRGLWLGGGWDGLGGGGGGSIILRLTLYIHCNI